MEKIKQLDRYQKVILLLMMAMVLVFTILYSITIGREGYAYMDAILVPSEENGTTTYSGKIDGEQAVFTVSADKTVEFRYGDKVYGPYSAKEDATAIPEDGNEGMVGIELYDGREIIFRGGVQRMDDYWWILNEDGGLSHIVVDIGTMNGTIMDEMEPTVSNILDLMTGPELTHKGDWFVWFCGVVLCFVTAISMIFADELFRINLSFTIRNVEHAEPSDWEMTRRCISWIVWPVIALIVFIVGLQLIV